MKVSIAKRLGVLSGVGVVLLVLVTIVGRWASGRVGADVRLLGELPAAVRGAAYADMDHDAVNVDVTGLAHGDASAADGRLAALTDDVQKLRADLASVKSSAHSAAVEALVDSVGKDVDAYASAASAVASAVRAGRVPDDLLAQFRTTDTVLAGDLTSVTKAAEDLVATMTKQANGAASRGRSVALALTLIAVIALCALAVVISRSIVRPVRRAADALNAVARGNLSQRLPVNNHDELGEMAIALNTALENLSQAMASISDHSGSLASSSEELTAVSSQLAMTAEETSAQASVVSAAAEQVSGNVSTVAAGTGQMASSIQEVSYNAQSAVRVAGEAAMVAESTNHTVAKLGASSAEIGSVVKVITSIAEQTNLLALNATIEAARAGEAGKGFAVVAHEVKELARATAGATADISERIAAIQCDAEAAVLAIGEITDIIGRVSETQSSIASAVDEQTATTSEIGNNVSEAAHGSTEIARNVSEMAEAFTQASMGAAQTREAATELSRMAHELQELVGAFQF